ncbi:MAG: hypothetical protein IPK82_20115 [Polyangiaceae bacterium]|nr:hypothetical protein [Polyangiaceae bacterium]
MSRHLDVTFEVTRGNDTDFFPALEDALRHAFACAAGSGEKVILDVLVSSPAGAKAWAGDDGVEQYLDDPEASVFERFELKVNSMGRVP